MSALFKQKAANWCPAVGETVYVPRLNARAKVVSANSATGALVLQAGLMKVNAMAEEVRKRE